MSKELYNEIGVSTCKEIVGDTEAFLGEVLTIIDASTEDPVKRKAMKDLVRVKYKYRRSMIESNLKLNTSILAPVRTR